MFGSNLLEVLLKDDEFADTFYWCIYPKIRKQSQWQSQLQ